MRQLAQLREQVDEAYAAMRSSEPGEAPWRGWDARHRDLLKMAARAELVLHERLCGPLKGTRLVYEGKSAEAERARREAPARPNHVPQLKAVE